MNSTGYRWTSKATGIGPSQGQYRSVTGHVMCKVSHDSALGSSETWPRLSSSRSAVRPHNRVRNGLELSRTAS
ncbi:hypothetical protein EIP91_006606 [Steccherinum ochraceum]|uniref:Uncharacterized protein n=1 Tax=Steccherinum ochraceum TaxID=92696 RepID=A0A4R0R874_9APHY|nr:hypothetical protein EIP91_006606 [Steccherinum ochraceum]